MLWCKWYDTDENKVASLGYLSDEELKARIDEYTQELLRRMVGTNEH